ncbi:hypothetical protein [Sporolactobacillus terrae]|uniref:hypothetical protein n=1 Tax=Sporolactobacillus terrae TaxID=269673 RepID=UPI000688367F|nr:hypothetical protein [Sporolactobacillus terrae]
MIKRTIIMLGIAVLLFGIPHMAFASNVGYLGTTTTSNWVTPDATNFDDFWIDVTVGGGSGQVIWYGLDGEEIGRSSTPGTVNAPTHALSFKLHSLDGSEVYAIVAHSTNSNDSTVYFSGSQGGGGDDGGGDSGGTTNITNNYNVNNYYEVPGWSAYMDKLDEILQAIPPAPNWGVVANTFRDSIVPAITSDFRDMLGSAPSPGTVPKGNVPSPGSAPSTPNVSVPDTPADPPELDDRGITEPTGQQADGLEDSAFTITDIKNEAPVIEERQDESGGFHILNPIDGLPSQEEFKQNKPNEGTANLPEDPKDPDNYSPNPVEPENPAPNKPKEEENTAPNPSESDNVAPKPSTSDNVAPKPSSGDNVAPSPSEGDNYAPAAPTEQENHSPKPSSSDNVAPTPGGTSGGFDSFPKPSGWSGGAPKPTADNSTAPLPNQDSGDAPIPSD